ncbi:MAG TPA: NAD(P)-dependent oxidoreductase [Burkholderiaceae bacterium]|nr:NAD(P)-dependent oxidoreductase [Burkholderiaceae bacterium]
MATTQRGAGAASNPAGPRAEARATGLHGGRLAAHEYARNFADSHPPLTHAQALIEAERCYYCHDAPCIAACPTGIDVPSFIQRIAQDNIRGAAKAILQANPLGGICARVCPTEVLCEQACVRNTNESKPVEIGQLQRHATDGYFAKPGGPLFERAAPTGKRIAVVGGGPAGLACAHGLAQRGHAVVLFDARPKLGGLNEYGIAAYKTTGGFAQKEVEWLLAIGGIEVRRETQLGRDMTLDSLLAGYDAVFLGLGLAGVNALGIAEPQARGLRAAVDFIAELRQAKDLSQLPVGRRVVVIGGGMTAVDAAVQARLLGAEESTIVYRRGHDAMSASSHEQDWAQTRGVKIRHWATPKEILAEGGAVTGVRFASTTLRDGKLADTADAFTLPADMVLQAIGQSFVAAPVGAAIELKAGRIATDAHGRTSHPRVWAGGDCRAGGRDLTVEAVQHGKVAALSIHDTLTGV